MSLRSDDEQLSLADQVRYLLEMYVEGPQTIAKIFGVFDTPSRVTACRFDSGAVPGLNRTVIGNQVKLDRVVFIAKPSAGPQFIEGSRTRQHFQSENAGKEFDAFVQLFCGDRNAFVKGPQKFNRRNFVFMVVIELAPVGFAC